MGRQDFGGRSLLSLYLSDIRSFPLLSKEEEIELGRRISGGIKQSADELVLSNLAFVVHIASEYKNMGLPFEDLVNEGNVGLIRAAGRYDHRKGIKFISYASWWVRKWILKALAEQASVVRVPCYQKKKQAQQKALVEAKRNQHRHSSADPPCDDCPPDPETFPRYRPVSLDDPDRPHGHPRLIEVLVDTRSKDPEREMMTEQDLARLELSFASLTDRERAILTARFGLSGSRVLTLREIGSRMGLSRERVRQIELAACDKLRSRLACDRFALLPGNTVDARSGSQPSFRRTHERPGLGDQRAGGPAWTTRNGYWVGGRRPSRGWTAAR